MKPETGSRMWGAVSGWGLVLGVVLGLGFAPVVHADDEDQNGGPGRAVRLSSVDGPVQIMQGGQVLTDQAVANTPLFEGSQLNTGNDGRAEVQFEDGSVARIPPQSTLTLVVLRPDGDTEIQLDSGMGYFELQDGNQGRPMRVRFGSAVLTASGFTVARVKLDDGPPNVAVFSGNARIEGDAGSVDLHGGESLALTTPNPADGTVAESIEPDSWDAWNSDRDQALMAAETAPGNPDVPQSNNPAWSDLNNSGAWYDVPGQGYVWSPYEASNSGWDPFGTGYWMWTPGYGYVWVSGESWGYMPYQCGAWNYYDAFGWGWAPGGCQPWWGGGYGGGGGWGFTVASVPRWYKLPIRPGPTIPHSPHPVLRRPMPVIPVHRTLPLQGGPLPRRDHDAPVKIAGNVATTVRSEPVHTMFNHQPAPGMRPMPGGSPERPIYGRPQQNSPERGTFPPVRPGDAGRPAPPPNVTRPMAPVMPRPSFGGEDRGGRPAPPPTMRSAPPPPPRSAPPPPPPAVHSAPPPPPAASHPK
ncbi:hypothetical protein DYQ86_00830 [Acidobacteria bacterium AB60]|nr:hypothetical protein DYQ86_00830 [Acidobacteria bacterium AB60]